MPLLLSFAPGVKRLTEAPDAGLGYLQTVACGVTEIDGAPPARPFEIGFDSHGLRREALDPGVKLGGRRAEAKVAWSQRAVRRHRQSTSHRRHARHSRVEDQQDLVAAAVEQMPAGHAGERLKAQHITVEGFGRAEV